MNRDRQADQRLIQRIGALRRRWLLVLEVASACALGAMIVSLFLPKVYRATTYILISESKIGTTPRDTNLQQMAMLGTFVPFLDNDALISETLGRLHLDAPPYNITVDRFRRRHLDVRIPKSTRLLELNIDFPDADLAAALANDLAQGAVRFNDKLNATDTTASQSFLKSRLREVEDSLARAAEAKLEVHLKARIEDREKDLSVLLAEKDSLSARLQSLRMELAQNEVRTKSLAEALEAEPETIRLTKSVTSDRFLELAAEKAGAGDAPLTVTEESVNSIREDLRRDYLNVAVSRSAQSAGVKATTARLDSVNAEIAQLLSLLVKLRSDIASAEQDYALAVEAIKGASREYEAASVTVSSKSQDIKQLGPAMAPERPVRPNTLMNVLAGFLLGALSCGFAVVVAQHYWDLHETAEDRVSDPLPPLAALPLERGEQNLTVRLPHS